MRLVLTLLLALTIATLSVAAQDTNLEPNDDNWCGAGNVWDDGRCAQGSAEEQDWHWMCGWYMAQVDNAVFTFDELRANVPLCKSLYPPLIERQSESITCNNPDDTDCDLLLDAWEMAYFGNLNQTATDDPDGDMCNNLCEQTLGTPPI